MGLARTLIVQFFNEFDNGVLKVVSGRDRLIIFDEDRYWRFGTDTIILILDISFYISGQKSHCTALQITILDQAIGVIQETKSLDGVQDAIVCANLAISASGVNSPPEIIDARFPNRNVTAGVQMQAVDLQLSGINGLTKSGRRFKLASLYIPCALGE